MIFDATKQELAACFITKVGEQYSVEPANVHAVAAEGKVGSALVTLALPAAARSGSMLEQLLGKEGTYDGVVRVVTRDGVYAGEGTVKIGNVGSSVLAAAAVSFALLVVVAFIARSSSRTSASGNRAFLKSVIVGNSGEASLSMFQIALWTVVTVFALVYVWWRTGNTVTLTTEMLGLLGFATAGSVAARWIAASRTPGAQTAGPPTREAERLSETHWQRLDAEARRLQVTVDTSARTSSRR